MARRGTLTSHDALSNGSPYGWVAVWSPQFTMGWDKVPGKLKLQPINIYLTPFST